MSRQTRHPLLLRTKNMATAYQNLSEYDFNSVPDGSEVTVGIVVAEWNKHITECIRRSGEIGMFRSGLPLVQ